MRVGATLCLVVFLVAVTPAAQGTTTANLVPNPGFELLSASCGGAPVCNWSPTSNVTLARDTSIKNSGAASLSFTLTGTPTFNVADSDCVNTPVAAGPHTGTGFWETSDPDTGLIEAGYAFYSGANCTGTLTERDASAVPVSDGAWHQFTQAFDVPAGTLSVRFALAVGVSSGSTTVNFDDLNFVDTPTALAVSSMSATRTRGGVAVVWRTGAEAGTLGFNVYREYGGRRARLNPMFVFARGQLAGRRYSYLDRQPAGSGAVYWIQVLHLDGSRSWYGPAQVAG